MEDTFALMMDPPRRLPVNALGLGQIFGNVGRPA
jgi:hypothetical protein